MPTPTEEQFDELAARVAALEGVVGVDFDLVLVNMTNYIAPGTDEFTRSIVAITRNALRSSVRVAAGLPE